MPPCRTHRATYEKFADGTTKNISDELPYDLPQGWAWARLGMIISLLNGDRGKNYPSKQSLDCVGRIPFISAVNIDDGNLIRRGLLYISEERFNKLRAGRLKLNDVVLCIRGSIGKFCVYPEPIGAIASSLVILRNGFGLDVNYISSYIRSSLFCREVKKFDNGTAQPNLAANDVVKFLIPLPPLAEQRRIVKKVDELFSYAGKIGESSDAIGRTAERIDKKILDLAIRGQLVPQDPHDEPASELVKRIEAAKRVNAGGRVSTRAASDRPAYEIDPPFDIPDSWEWVNLGAISNYGECQTIDAISIPPKTWSLDLEEIEKGTGRLLVRKFAGEKASTSSKHKFSKGMILYSKLRTYLNKVLIADMDGVCTSEIIPITLFGDILPEYIRTVLMSPYFLAYTASKDYGVKMPRVGTADARAALIPLPPLSEQKRIVSKIAELRMLTRKLVTL